MSEERNFNILPSGKQIAIFKVANTALYRVAFTDGGEVPEELSGMWTDPYKAQLAIKAYITKREAEAKVEKETVEDTKTHIIPEVKEPAIPNPARVKKSKA